MDTASQVAHEFASLAVTVLPWFLLGVVAAAAIQTFLPDRWVSHVFAGRRGLPAALAIGALAPGCSRVTMPVAVGLRANRGPQLGTLTALVFVSPLLSPITVVLTWSVLGWRMTVGRVLAALVVRG